MTFSQGIQHYHKYIRDECAASQVRSGENPSVERLASSQGSELLGRHPTRVLFAGNIEHSLTFCYLASPMVVSS